MEDAIKIIQENFSRKTGERDYLRHEIKEIRRAINHHRKRYEDSMHARALLQEVAEKTQIKLEAHISGIVTSALKAVFPDPYEFLVRFIKRRNKTECDLLFEKDGEEFKPVESSGGGPLDVASIALRISQWSLSKELSNVIVLDEPGKFVSSDLQHKVSRMLKVLADKLGIQFIIISHQPDMIDAADKVFEMRKGELING